MSSDGFVHGLENVYKTLFPSEEQVQQRKEMANYAKLTKIFCACIGVAVALSVPGSGFISLTFKAFLLVTLHDYFFMAERLQQIVERRFTELRYGQDKEKALEYVLEPTLMVGPMFNLIMSNASRQRSYQDSASEMSSEPAQ